MVASQWWIQVPCCADLFELFVKANMSRFFIDRPIFANVIGIVTMILGRLGLLAVLILILPRFWRD